LTSTSSVGSASQNLLVSNSFQFYDDAFWTRGNHSFKFGVAVERIQFNALTLQRPNGQFTFSSLQNFLNDVPSKVQELQAGNALEVGSRNTAMGFYAQDDWKVKTNLSVTLGLRYEPVTLPIEAHNQFAVLTSLDPSVIGTENLTPVKTLWSSNPSLKNFEPRIGFSWDPFKDGKTAVRAGFGIFDVLPLPYEFGLNTAATAPFQIIGADAGATLGSGIDSKVNFDETKIRNRFIDAHPSRAYVMNWNLNIQRQLAPGYTLLVGYVGSRSLHLSAAADDINLVQPVAVSGVGLVFPCDPSVLTAGNTCANQKTGTRIDKNWGG
jgi:hypothetical protein